MRLILSNLIFYFAAVLSNITSIGANSVGWGSRPPDFGRGFVGF